MQFLDRLRWLTTTSGRDRVISRHRWAEHVRQSLGVDLFESCFRRRPRWSGVRELVSLLDDAWEGGCTHQTSAVNRENICKWQQLSRHQCKILMKRTLTNKNNQPQSAKRLELSRHQCKMQDWCHEKDANKQEQSVCRWSKAPFWLCLSFCLFLPAAGECWMKFGVKCSCSRPWAVSVFGSLSWLKFCSCTPVSVRTPATATSWWMNRNESVRFVRKF